MPTLSEILDSLPTYMAEQKEERRQAIDDWSKRKPSVETAWENIPARRAAQHRYDLNQANYAAVPGEENRGEAQEAAWQDYDRFNLTRNQLNQERTKRAEAFKNEPLEQANNLREAQLYAQDARKRDGREEAAWEQIQENRLAAANETLPEEVGRDGPTEALWKAKDRLQTTQPQKASTAETGNGEFSTASTAPSRDSDRWGVKFDPNETASSIRDGILSQPMAIPDASSRGKTQVTPQMAQQVQALEQVYSTRDPRLIPGNPQFDMFAFADYLLGLRAKNQALYQQRMAEPCRAVTQALKHHRFHRR